MPGRSERRDPSRPGLAGISAELWGDLEAGRRTTAELAAFAGTSSAAVSKAKRKRQQAAGGSSSLSPAAQGAGVSPLPPKGADSDPNPQTTGPTSAEDLAASAAMWSLYRAHEALAGGGLGPASIKAAAQAVELSLGQLRQLGRLTEPDDAGDQLAELRVSVMSADEIAKLKAAHVDLGEDRE